MKIFACLQCLALAEDPTLPTDIVGAYKMAVREISDLRRENFALKQQLAQMQHPHHVVSAGMSSVGLSELSSSHLGSSPYVNNESMIAVVVQQPYQ